MEFDIREEEEGGTTSDGVSEFLSNGLATTSLHIKKNWSVVLKLVGVKEEENKIPMNEKWSFNLKKERAKSMI